MYSWQDDERRRQRLLWIRANRIARIRDWYVRCYVVSCIVALTAMVAIGGKSPMPVLLIGASILVLMFSGLLLNKYSYNLSMRELNDWYDANRS